MAVLVAIRFNPVIKALYSNFWRLVSPGKLPLLHVCTNC
ncbi:hypothetical protein K8W50_004997 [Escherichia coli]|nr:hypothetical protein [Escherichia coli]